MAKKVIIVEGILIFCEPELRKLLDVKIFVDTVSIVVFHRAGLVCACVCTRKYEAFQVLSRLASCSSVLCIVSCGKHAVSFTVAVNPLAA